MHPHSPSYQSPPVDIAHIERGHGWERERCEEFQSRLKRFCENEGATMLDYMPEDLLNLPSEISPLSSQPPRRTESRTDCETTSEACPPRFFMWRVCSACGGLRFGIKPCGPEDHLKKTHGLCPEHEARAMRNLKILRAKNFIHKNKSE